MSTFPSNHNHDWTTAETARWRSSSPDAFTTGAYYAATAERQAIGPTLGQAPTAWSAEQPEFNCAPASYPAQQQRWYARRSVAAMAGAVFVAAAAAGLFGALHGSSSTPVDIAAQTAPAQVQAPEPASAAAPAPGYPPTSHSTGPNGGYTAPARHPARRPAPPAPQGQPSADRSAQSHHDSGSDSSQSNDSGNYWTHRDHDSRWDFFSRDHDSDNSRRSPDHDNSRSSHHDNSGSSDGDNRGSSSRDNSGPSNGQSSDSHSSGSNESGDSK